MSIQKLKYQCCIGHLDCADFGADFHAWFFAVSLCWATATAYQKGW